MKNLRQREPIKLNLNVLVVKPLTFFLKYLSKTVIQFIKKLIELNIEVDLFTKFKI